MKFTTDGSALLCIHQGEKLRIEPWGRDSLRVRATMLPDFSGRDWALTEDVEKGEARITVEEVDHWVGDGSIDKRELAAIVNGRMKAVVNHAGVISFYRDDTLFLREYFRSYDGTISRESRCLKVVNREWKGITGGSEYSLE